MELLSIIICNYNYARFLCDAIESAIAVDWPYKEVIVIDDGSTDESWCITKSYGNRVVSIRQENAGLNAAANMGFRASKGEVIIFLDSDDVLHSSVGQCVAERISPSVAKVQYALTRTDVTLQRHGDSWPEFRQAYTPEEVSAEMRRTGMYDYSVTSGNAWSRWFLDKVFPLPTAREGLATGFDQYLSRLAPFYGDVATIPKALGLYRIHGGNNSGIAGFSLAHVEKTIAREDVYIRLLNLALAKELLGPVPENRSEPYVMSKLVMRKLRSGRLDDHTYLIVKFLEYAKSVWFSRHALNKRLMNIAWAACFCLAPETVAVKLVSKRGARNHLA
ncbi:MAG: glycosyltransferase family 2 protein [Alphaproteobacteria bacterium]|nr:glycosyltransferase family 2 protein [Alphaproteobacteria bacterium]